MTPFTVEETKIQKGLLAWPLATGRWSAFLFAQLVSKRTADWKKRGPSGWTPSEVEQALKQHYLQKAHPEALGPGT